MDKTDIENGLIEEDEMLWHFFGAIHESRKNKGRPSGLEEGVTSLRQSILLSPCAGLHRPSSRWGQVKARVVRLSGRTPGIEARIDWLRKTGAFDEKDFTSVRRSKLFYEKPTGEVLMRMKGIDLATANAVIATLALVVGIWAGWVIFSGHSGIQMIANSYVVGSTLGVIIGRVLDRSFRFQRIQANVLAVAPWFAQTANH